MTLPELSSQNGQGGPVRLWRLQILVKGVPTQGKYTGVGRSTEGQVGLTTEREQRRFGGSVGNCGPIQSVFSRLSLLFVMTIFLHPPGTERFGVGLNWSMSFWVSRAKDVVPIKGVWPFKNRRFSLGRGRLWCVTCKMFSLVWGCRTGRLGIVDSLFPQNRHPVFSVSRLYF